MRNPCFSIFFPDPSRSEFAPIYLKCCLFRWSFDRILAVSEKVPC